MPSSTSSSSLRVWIWSVPVVGCLLLLGLELASRTYVTRSSRILSLMEQEARAATAMRDSRGVLFLGSSLLNSGIHLPIVNSELNPDWNASRWVVYQTSFHDWYYGIRRLAHDGSRPGVLALMLNVPHLIGFAYRGDVSAHYLLNATDLPALRSELDIHPTKAATYLLSHYSRFFGLRAEIRKNVIRLLIPSAPTLMTRLTNVSTPPIDESSLRHVGAERLQRLKVLSDTLGIPIVLVIAPLPDADGSEIVATMARQIGLPVIALPERSFQPSEFTDGLHLNDSGAERFSRATGIALKALLRGNNRAQR